MEAPSEWQGVCKRFPNGTPSTSAFSAAAPLLLQFPNPVSAEKQAKRFFVSGLVQGVGFRYFAQDAAERLHLAGYVRNLRDGRVEAYAIGTEEHLHRFLAALKKGPRGAMVHGVLEESAALDSQHENEFSITHDL